MNYLSVEKLSKNYNEKQILDSLSFGIDKGQKVALVGVNGCGKSTLLRILNGLETPDQGQVRFRDGIKVAMLPQSPVFDDNADVLSGVFDDEIEDLRIIKAYELALYKAEKGEENHEELGTLMEKMDSMQAWDFESNIKQILGKLGIHDLDQKMNELSGGQRKRVALARALVVAPDFLILDEPTNHLDLEIIEWLENYLKTANLSLLMVTHDRYFLDQVTNEIFELEDGALHQYHGNYSYFVEKKQERTVQRTTEASKAQNLMKKELEWMRRQPRARGTKAKYRVEAFHDLKEQVSKKVDQQELELNLKTKRQGKKIIELHHVKKAWERITVLKDFSYVFRKKERVGIVGKNGVGKSTFLEILIGKVAPDSGTIDAGQTTKFGYYTQEESVFDPSKRVIDIVQEVAEVISLSNGSVITASQLLNQFLFPPKMQFNLVGKLSGGERRRLQLLRVLMSNPNFLILDEPTNDLDIMTLNVLEEFLDNFDGCLLIVSHDRYFLDRLVDHLFVFDGNGEIRDFPGNYTDFRESKSRFSSSSDAPKPTQQVSEKPRQKKSNKISFKEQKEKESLEDLISTLEQKKKILTQKLQTASEDHEKLQAISKEIAEIANSLEEKELRWLELSELEG